MIEISGTANVRVDYSIEVDKTEEEWDSMSRKAQDEYIENHVDWFDACRSGTVEDIEVDDLNVLSEEDAE